MYPNLGKLDGCNKTLIFETNLHNKAPDAPIRACTFSPSAPKSRRSSLLLKVRQFLSFEAPSEDERTAFDVQETSADVQLFDWAGEGKVAGHGSQLATEAANHLQGQSGSVGTSILLMKKGDAIVGVYAGSQIEKPSAADISRRFANRDTRQSTTQSAAQICSKDSLSTQIMGVFLDLTGDMVSVRSALRDWSKAVCIKDAEPSGTWSDVSVSTIPGEKIPVGPAGGNSSAGGARKVQAAAECEYTQVKAGDGCWALADRCKITQEKLKEYNDPGVCDNPKEGDYVCCSEGELPDFSPQPNPDGSCKSYTIDDGDDCWAIADSNDMTVDMIKNRNNDTWGWAGCDNLIVGAKICLSKGSPPMPSPLENAICGPQVPGTEKPDDMDDLVDLNPCPLKACCNVWGQCGITEEFCIPSPADTGAPGTSKPGENGCVSSCGMNITNNDEPPENFMKVGYFEAWNLDRPCLHMRVSASLSFPGSELTAIYSPTKSTPANTPTL